ncbi:serine/threonine protein kinase [Streptomyces olivoreticuli]|uniref:serine/threonine protein kinase n=1 Tax=Streptomyces olivoreticuli TaxID=68246 RepID=UPI000E26505C|nr:serine/threonine-protein kinase [Streptomyces olivoreticuli]
MTERVLGDRYRLVERLAGGSMGDVWLGWDDVLERQVAVKLLRPLADDDAGFDERFRVEAKVMARLNHPGIVSVYDYGQSDAHEFPTAFLVMELVDGEPLTTLLDREGPLPVPRALEFTDQILDALHTAHEAGIVHRDIKPANLLVREGRVLVADFGIARPAFSPRLTASGLRLGTAPYQAPEQASRGGVTPSVDLYAVGVVLYEMLSGRVPFDGETAFEITLKHLTEPPPALPDDVPPSVGDFVRQALSKTADERRPDAASMRRALAEVREGLSDGVRADGVVGVGATPAPAGVPGRPRGGWSTRRNALVAGAVVVALAFLVSLTVSAGSAGDGRRYAADDPIGSSAPYPPGPSRPGRLVPPSTQPSGSGSAYPTGGAHSQGPGAAAPLTPLGHRSGAAGHPASPQGVPSRGAPAPPAPWSTRPLPPLPLVPTTSAPSDDARPPSVLPSPSRPEETRTPSGEVEPSPLPQRVRFHNGGLRLANIGGRDMNGSEVATTRTEGDSGEVWQLQHVETDRSFMVTNLATANRRLLDMDKGKQYVQMWEIGYAQDHRGTPDGYFPNQRWRFYPVRGSGRDYAVMNADNGRCLTAKGAAVRAVVEDCRWSTDQIWTVEAA